MSDESTTFDPYEAVLRDLRAKRDELDTAIAAIERVRGGASATGAAAAPETQSHIDPPEGPGAFLGMTIGDAAAKLLKNRRRQLNNSEFVAAFKAGGLVMNSADPMNTVNSVLTRRFNTQGDIVRVDRGTWGLAEWYPNRSFKKKEAKTETAPKSEEEEMNELLGITPERKPMP